MQTGLLADVCTCTRHALTSELVGAFAYSRPSTTRPTLDGTQPLPINMELLGMDDNPQAQPSSVHEDIAILHPPSRPCPPQPSLHEHSTKREVSMPPSPTPPCRCERIQPKDGVYGGGNVDLDQLRSRSPVTCTRSWISD